CRSTASQPVPATAASWIYHHQTFRLPNTVKAQDPARLNWLPEYWQPWIPMAPVPVPSRAAWPGTGQPGRSLWSASGYAASVPYRPAAPAGAATDPGWPAYEPTGHVPHEHPHPYAQSG